MIKKHCYLSVLLLISFSIYADIIYVKNDGTGNGTSWSQAYGDLNVALQNAVSGDEIWVAQGVYFPSSTLNPAESFVFKDGVKLYGGFEGTETLLEERADISGTTTILSGNLSGSIHTEILFKINNASNADNLIDGFTIKGAKRVMVNGQQGGVGIQIINSTIAIKNSIIKDNHLESTDFILNQEENGGGSAIFSYNSNLDLENVDILENSVDSKKITAGGTIAIVPGGAMYIYGGTFNYDKGRIENNEYTFEGSQGRGGAGYFINVNNLTLTNLFVYNNKVLMSNLSPLGVMKPEGGAFYFVFCNDIFMDTNIFHGNYGIYSQSNSTNIYGNGNAINFYYSTGVINNTTFGKNMRPEHMNVIGSYGEVIHTSSTINLTFNNCVFLQKFNYVFDTINYFVNFNRCVTKHPMGDPENNHWAEMEFVNASKANYMPLYCSTHLDFGDLDYVSSGTDIYGQPRVVGASSDPGAVEFQSVGEYDRIYVNHANTHPFKEGLSWDTAFDNLHDALNCQCRDSLDNIIVPTEIWVAEGIYKAGKNVEDTFLLNDGQKVYGGFKAGDELLTDRDSTLVTQQTILTGKYEEGVHVGHVVSSIYTHMDTELNSFIVEEGQTPASGDVVTLSGAGIYVRGQATLKNLWVRNNKANGAFSLPGQSYTTHWGAGIFVYRYDYGGVFHSGVHIENTKITDNIAGGYGGGIAFFQIGGGNLSTNNVVSVFKNVEITGNKAIREDGNSTFGGGIFVEGRFSIDFEDFNISDNEAASRAVMHIVKNDGAVLNFKRGIINNNTEYYHSWNSYAVAITSINTPNTVNMESVIFSRNNTARTTIYVSKSSLDIINCTFTNNEGGLHENVAFKDGNFIALGENTSVSLKNSIIDYSDNGLPDIYTFGSGYSITAKNTLFTKEIPTEITNPENNLANTNPLFVDRENGDYNLQDNSPAINAGNNDFLLLSPDLDVELNNRIHAGIVDLGALEFQGTVSINEQNKNEQFLLYPNPANHEVFIEFDKYQKGNLTIYDLQGKLVFVLNNIEVDIDMPLRIDIGSIQSGVYMISWEGSRFKTSVKLIKK